MYNTHTHHSLQAAASQLEDTQRTLEQVQQRFEAQQLKCDALEQQQQQRGEQGQALEGGRVAAHQQLLAQLEAQQVSGACPLCCSQAHACSDAPTLHCVAQPLFRYASLCGLGLSSADALPYARPEVRKQTG